MDDSQSSDLLSNSMDSCNSPQNMGSVPYDTLLKKTKNSLDEYLRNGIPKTSLSAHFSSLLEDCNTCISQSMDIIIGLLVDTEVHYRTLIDYMEHAVCLLQMLSNFIKTIMESVSLSCHTMSTFPVMTGNIVMVVFNHCKDSETLYGKHLKHVEKQLKDLFRTCHELQLTYLMVMEKHFIFDLTEKEEQDILMKALDINLAIGEIVQTLDVKTMAEQWKAYTAICEKYSNFLSDKVIFQDCTKILCAMTMNNITTALQPNLEDKIVLRSLKIASFTIKIILKLCGIFKSASGRNYTSIMELFVFIYKHNGPYLELVNRKSPQFINQMTILIHNPCDLLLAQLICDDVFSECCLHLNTETLRKKDGMIGYIILLTSAMARALDKNTAANEFKRDVIRCSFSILPKCHIWFNKGLKFTNTKHASRPYGLYEHILIHTIALASTLSCEQYTALERLMYEALLGTDCWSALFASDLWVALARNNRELLQTQMIFLCKTYKTFENNHLFYHSPQKVHLSYTIARLFELMETRDKIKLYDNFNLALWTPLQIKNMPSEVQEKAVEDIINELLTKFENFLSSNIQSENEIRQMSKLMKAASTCRFVDGDETFEDYVIKVWLKSCPKNRIVLNQSYLDTSHMWYLGHLEALVALTKAMTRLKKDDGALAKILHVMANIAQLGNTELNLAILDLLCQLALQTCNEDKNALESLTTDAFKSIIQKSDNVIHNCLLTHLRKYTDHKNYEYVVAQVFSLDDSLQEIYSSFLQGTTHDNEQWNHLTSVYSTYTHKCIESPVVELLSSGSSREKSSNFEFADIDSLFGGDDPEPASKKAKYTNEGRLGEIVARLEADSLLLSSEKENVFSTEEISRIRIVSDRLRNIID
ncbi:FIGNL1-interacting regulator of recombination and mitosis-like isoform X1 [Cydia fagiglandana]|uniref:FIGNL1-interacting regulator of recombination and mitosis-like isoform X1 n=2 Tax=Cydia fagiglandana TaxID=1458189 RepID=UPI002FEE4EDA